MNNIIDQIQNPSDLNLILSTAQSSLKDGNMDQAEELFRESLSISPNSARALVGIGHVEIAKQDTTAAIEKYEEAIRKNPNFIEAYGILVDLYEEVGNLDALLNVAARAHHISPDNPKYTLVLARVFLEVGKFEESVKFFKKSLFLSPKLAEAYRGLGSVYYEQKEYDKAIKQFKKALDLVPGDMALLNSLGLSYVKKNLINQGIEYYRMALRMDGSSWQILFNVGYAYEKLGNIKWAVEHYERALSVNPQLEKARRRILFLNQSAPKAS